MTRPEFRAKARNVYLESVGELPEIITGHWEDVQHLDNRIWEITQLPVYPRSTPYKGDALRMVRRTPIGTFVMRRDNVCDSFSSLQNLWSGTLKWSWKEDATTFCTVCGGCK